MPKVITAINAVRKCINALQYNGWLSYFDLIQFPSALNLFPAQTNLIGGAQTSGFSGTYTWQKKTGFVPDGITGITNTSFNPTLGVAYAQNDAHLGVYFRSTSSQNGVDLGAFSGVAIGSWFSSKYGDSNTYSRINASTSANHGNIISDTRGYITAERSNGTHEKIYKDGVLLATTANTSTGRPNFSLYGCAINNAGSILLPSNKAIGIVTAGKSGVNNATVNQIFNQYFIDIGAPVMTSYAFGDSLTLGVGAGATSIYTSWAGDLFQRMNWNLVNSGVGGQTVTLNTDNPFNPANLPTFNSTYDGYLFLAWGINDCWKTHGGSPATVANFKADLLACITTATTTKGWNASRIKLITGYWLADNAYFTRATYLTYADGVNEVGTTTGVQSIDLRNYTWALNADNVHPLNDNAYNDINNYIFSSLAK